jgi:nucleoid DNA-binding protein
LEGNLPYKVAVYFHFLGGHASHLKILRDMTKRDIVTRISQDSGYVQEQVFDIVQRTLDVLSDALRRGETIELRNFGVFEVKIRKARVGRNPNRPEKDVPIPARAVVKFKPGKEMRAAVLKLTNKISDKSKA